MTIAVLGAGMVGRAIALDLAKNYSVISFDVNESNLKMLKEKNPEIQTVVKDLKIFSSYPDFLTNIDLVVTAVPGFMGFDTLQAVINCYKNVVDISFFPEDALQLDSLAKEKNITAIVDSVEPCSH